MKTYQEVKNDELIVTRYYSKRKLDRYIWFCKVLRKLFSETFFWIVSFIPFLAIPSVFIYLGFFKLNIMTVSMFTVLHFLYWFLKGRKEAIKLIDENLPELDLSIEVLQDIRKERHG
jgi:hypothetical protein